MKAVIIAAPSTGSGKTTVTLGLLRALRRRGVAVRGAKIGPDYIDPRFHEAATGRPCYNVDTWAMPADRIAALMAGDGPLVIEAAMGLLDGAGGTEAGSAHQLAQMFDLPVILVVDCQGAGLTLAAQIHGIVSVARVQIHGLILNRVGSDRHEALLHDIFARPLNGMTLPPIIGVLRRDDVMAHPRRHLGLVQAEERTDLEEWLDGVADRINAGVDLDRLFDAEVSQRPTPAPGIAPPGQRIAVARDAAFAFSYPHLLEGWRQSGAEITLFSPLADDPVPPGDFVYLPGGYPELHAGRLAGNQAFLKSLKSAAEISDIYGECGGYMVLGDSLTDADGVAHPMAGLLRLQTSFATRKLHLGYRMLRGMSGPFDGAFSGHEFHHSTQVSALGDPLFAAWDHAGHALPDMGLRLGRVCGSYAHLIDRADHLSVPPLRPDPENDTVAPTDRGTP